jgi:hypothetical protein
MPLTTRSSPIPETTPEIVANQADGTEKARISTSSQEDKI